jgi:hypothetical protein
MWKRRLSSIATAGVIALASFLMTGCSSTTKAYSVPIKQCPKPVQPDQRLLSPPCFYLPVGTDPEDTDDIGTVTHNNQCARQNRNLLIEWQRWHKEIKQ